MDATYDTLLIMYFYTYYIYTPPFVGLWTVTSL